MRWFSEKANKDYQSSVNIRQRSHMKPSNEPDDKLQFSKPRNPLGVFDSLNERDLLAN